MIIFTNMLELIKLENNLVVKNIILITRSLFIFLKFISIKSNFLNYFVFYILEYKSISQEIHPSRRYDTIYIRSKSRANLTSKCKIVTFSLSKYVHFVKIINYSFGIYINTGVYILQNNMAVRVGIWLLKKNEKSRCRKKRGEGKKEKIASLQILSFEILY